MKPKAFRFEKRASWEEVASFHVSLKEMQEEKFRSAVNKRIDMIITETEGKNPDKAISWIKENGKPMITMGISWAVDISKGVYILYHEVIIGYELVEFDDL